MYKDQEYRKITFTINQLQLAEYKSHKMGISFQEYIRYLVSKDTENILNKFDMLNVDEINKIEDALNDRKNSRFTASINRKKLDKFLSELKPDQVD